MSGCLSRVQFADPPFATGSITVRALAGVDIAVRHAASFAILEPQPDARIVAELVRRHALIWPAPEGGLGRSLHPGANCTCPASDAADN